MPGGRRCGAAGQRRGRGALTGDAVVVRVQRRPVPGLPAGDRAAAGGPRGVTAGVVRLVVLRGLRLLRSPGGLIAGFPLGRGAFGRGFGFSGLRAAAAALAAWSAAACSAAACAAAACRQPPRPPPGRPARRPAGRLPRRPCARPLPRPSSGPATGCTAARWFCRPATCRQRRAVGGLLLVMLRLQGGELVLTAASESRACCWAASAATFAASALACAAFAASSAARRRSPGSPCASGCLQVADDVQLRLGHLPEQFLPLQQFGRRWRHP